MNIIKKGIRYIIRTTSKNLTKVYPYEVLSKLIKENNFKSYAEIGIWKGKTLFELAEQHQNIKIYGVDPFTPTQYKDYCHGEQMAQTNINQFSNIKDSVIRKASKLNNTEIIIKESLEASRQFKDNSLDIIFIDGSHDYKNVCQDIKAWLPKLTNQGILTGHDFCLRHFDVIKAVGDTLGHNIQVKEDVNMWIYYNKKC